MSLSCKLCLKYLHFDTSHDAQNSSYFFCENCKSLQLNSTSNFSNSLSTFDNYAPENNVYKTIKEALKIVSALKIIGVTNDNVCLDYGYNSSLFCRIMRDLGFNFYSFELHFNSNLNFGFNWSSLKKNTNLITILNTIGPELYNKDQWDNIFKSNPKFIFGRTTFLNKYLENNSINLNKIHHKIIFSQETLIFIANFYQMNAYMIGEYFLLSRIILDEFKMSKLNEWVLKDESEISLEDWFKLSEKNSEIDRTKISKRIQLKRNSIKIALDGVFFKYSSGIARLWRSILREWSDNGFCEFVFILNREYKSPVFDGFLYIDIKNIEYNNFSSDEELLQKVCDDHKIHHFISTYFTKPLRTKTTLLVNDMIPEVLQFNLNEKQWQDKKSAINNASNFITISNSTKTDLIKFYPSISENQINLAYCGCNFQTPNIDKINQFKYKYKISKNYFILSGNTEGYKNGILFFKAFEKFAETRGNYSIVLTNSQYLHDDLKKYVANAECFNLILSDEELECAYAGALALVYPSKYEGFGLPILEAMRCSCPVITCMNSSIPEVGGNAVTYVDSENPMAMFSALNQVQIESYRIAKILAGLEQAEKFNWRKMADDVESAVCNFILKDLNIS